MRFVVFYSVLMLVLTMREIAGPGLPDMSGSQKFALAGITFVLVLFDGYELFGRKK